MSRISHLAVVVVVAFAGCSDDMPEPDVDTDGDGVVDEADDFPTDSACAVRDDDNCSACAVGCGPWMSCSDAGACTCMEPYVGASCDEVEIAAGTFTLGSPETEPCRGSNEVERAVTLTRAIVVKTTEVTQAAWSVLMGENPSTFDGCESCPVEEVGWWDALAYTNALNQSVGLPVCYTLSGCSGTPGAGDYTCEEVGVSGADGTPYSCLGYRLPTEVEWEAAARAGSDTGTYNGDIALADCEAASTTLEPIAWYGENSGDQTHPVALKEPNASGLYDMVGNVWEWTWDSFGGNSSLDPVTDPDAGALTTPGVVRGCAWYNLAKRCRVANRPPGSPGVRTDGLGLRVVRTLP